MDAYFTKKALQYPDIFRKFVDEDLRGRDDAKWWIEHRDPIELYSAFATYYRKELEKTPGGVPPMEYAKTGAVYEILRKKGWEMGVNYILTRGINGFPYILTPLRDENQTVQLSVYGEILSERSLAKINMMAIGRTGEAINKEAEDDAAHRQPEPPKGGTAIDNGNTNGQGTGTDSGGTDITSPTGNNNPPQGTSANVDSATIGLNDQGFTFTKEEIQRAMSMANTNWSDALADQRIAALPTATTRLNYDSSNAVIPSKQPRPEGRSFIVTSSREALHSDGLQRPLTARQCDQDWQYFDLH